MSPLSWVLIGKIALTIALCILLLLFPTSLLKSLGLKVPEPILFFRLLGIAYAALAVGYAFGLQTSRLGGYPAGVVWVGIVSNGGAFLYLVLNAVSGTWAAWGFVAWAVMWSSLVVTGVITAGLITFGVWPNYLCPDC